MNYSVVQLGEGKNIAYQGAATAETHTMCSRQRAIKEPLQLIVFRKQWPPIYHACQQLQHPILSRTLSPLLVKAESWTTSVILKDNTLH